MTVSAFGVDDYRISKADDKKRRRQDAALLAAGTAGTAAAYGGDHVERGARVLHAEHHDKAMEHSVRAMGSRARGRSDQVDAALRDEHVAAAKTARKWAVGAKRVKYGGLGLAAGALTPLAVRGIRDQKEKVGKALGDPPKARHAQERKKAGLGAAGVGYLAATRAKDVSPHAAEMVTRSAKKIGEAERATRIARKVKVMDQVAGKGGAGLVAAGLGLATEGYINDLRHRKVFERAKKKTFGKAYTPGEIAYHDTQSQIHSRKASAANKRKNAGYKTAGAGLAGGYLGYQYAPEIARTAGRMADKTETHTKLANAARKTTNVRRAAVLGGAGLAAAGAGLITEGHITGTRNRGKKTAELRAVQAARQRRNAAELNKSAFFVEKAFDSERQRHKRADLYEGAAAGGAVAAGTGAGVLAGKSVKLKVKAAGKTKAAANNRAEASAALRRMNLDPKDPIRLVRNKTNVEATARRLRSAAGQDAVARKARIASRALSGGAKGAALGAAGLGAAAYGIHRSDRKGSGRSYAY